MEGNLKKNNATKNIKKLNGCGIAPGNQVLVLQTEEKLTFT
jgi:hypothetical protein